MPALGPLAHGKVPAAATAVTISMNIGLNQGGRKPPTPVTIGGRAQPALAGPGTDTGPRIVKAAGLPWTIPTD